MVMECRARPTQGSLGFAMRFIEESLNSSQRQRPWFVVEVSDGKSLWAAGMSQELRLLVAQGQLFWVRIEGKKLIPEIVHLLLESSLCEGVLLRGFEEGDSARAQVWMRRWQLACESYGTHLLWCHEQDSELVGPSLKLSWSAKTKINLLKGWASVERPVYKSLKGIKEKLEEREASDVNRSPARVA